MTTTINENTTENKKMNQMEKKVESIAVVAPSSRRIVASFEQPMAAAFPPGTATSNTKLYRVTGSGHNATFELVGSGCRQFISVLPPGENPLNVYKYYQSVQMVRYAKNELAVKPRSLKMWQKMRAVEKEEWKAEFAAFKQYRNRHQ